MDVFLGDVNVLLKRASAEKIVNVDITALVEAIVLASKLIQSCVLEVLMKITFLKCSYKNKYKAVNLKSETSKDCLAYCLQTL